jgi:hypothetical protein
VEEVGDRQEEQQSAAPKPSTGQNSRSMKPGASSCTRFNTYLKNRGMQACAAASNVTRNNPKASMPRLPLRKRLNCDHDTLRFFCDTGKGSAPAPPLATAKLQR